MAYFITLLAIVMWCYYFIKFKNNNDLILILPLFYTSTLLYVFIGVYFFDYAKDVPFDMYKYISDDQLIDVGIIYLLASLSFYIGSRLARVKSNNSLRDTSVENINQNVILFLFLFVFIIYILSYGGIEPLISRRGYISTEYERNKTLQILFYLVSPFTFVLLPYLKSKVYRYFIFFIIFMMLFSSSSRFIIMLPFIYIIGSYLKNKKIILSVFILNVFLIAVTLIFILQIRYYTYHGLIPNLRHLFTKGIDYNYIFIGLNYAFSFSMMGTAYVLNNFEHDTTSFIISVNPLPSFILGDEKLTYMLSSQEMMKTAPVSALSLISLTGYIGVFLFYSVTGFCFSYMIKKMKNKTFLYYIILGLFLMFTLFSIQYNMRGLTRFFYYSLVIYVSYLLVFRFNYIFGSKNKVRK